MASKTRDLSDKELREYFAEHVRYEIQMLLNATTAILRQLEVPQGLQHMAVESYAIHLRNLITFLFPEVLRDTDVCARDFFIDAGKWLQTRPELSDLLKNAKRRADKEVGHLTIFRQAGTPEGKEWDVRNLTNELMPLLELFVEHSDKVVLADLYQEVKEHYSLVKAL